MSNIFSVFDVEKANKIIQKMQSLNMSFDEPQYCKVKSAVYINGICAVCGASIKCLYGGLMRRTTNMCVKCCVDNKKKIADNNLKEDVVKAGLKVIKVYADSFKIVCSHGHEFVRSKKKLKENRISANGVTCPHCWKGSAEEERFRFMIETHFGKKFPTSYPEWLVNHNTGYKMELDMYCAELNLAIEYNGVHHYQPIYGEDNLESVMKKDELKVEMCQDNGVKLIQIKADQKSSSINGLLESWCSQLKLAGIDINKQLFKKVKEKQISTVKMDKKVEEIEEFLEKHNMKWKSGVYVNKTSFLRIGFSDCDHEKSIEARKVTKVINENYKCVHCEHDKRVESLAKIMATQMGVKFIKMTYREGKCINGFEYKNKKGGIGIVSKYKWQEFIREINAKNELNA